MDVIISEKTIQCSDHCKISLGYKIRKATHVWWLNENVVTWMTSGHGLENQALENFHSSTFYSMITNTTKWTKFLCLVQTWSIVVAFSSPSNGQNFTSTPFTSSNQLHKCQKKCSRVPRNIWYNYIDFHQVNYTLDLGSLLLFSSLESIDFVGCYAIRLKDDI